MLRDTAGGSTNYSSIMTECHICHVVPSDTIEEVSCHCMLQISMNLLGSVVLFSCFLLNDTYLKCIMQTFALTSCSTYYGPIILIFEYLAWTLTSNIKETLFSWVGIVFLCFLSLMMTHCCWYHSKKKPWKTFKLDLKHLGWLLVHYK